MKKLVFPFVEIEVPDDCPDGLDFEASFAYFRERPELVEKISRQYRKAYDKWVKTRNFCHAPKTTPSHQTKA